MISNTDEFHSDWASPPGNTITCLLEEESISAGDLREHIGYTPNQFRELIDGKSTISIGLARKLTEFVGSSVEFWIERDSQYQQKLESLREANDKFLSKLPVEDMIRFGWLELARSPAEQLTKCLDFFGISNATEWFRIYEQNEYELAFRTSHSFRLRPGAVSAWLRQGEVVANQISCAPWSPRVLKEQIPAIRSLTRVKDPGNFLPKLKCYCAEAGVAMAVVRAPRGCSASGVVRFLNTKKALVQLSFRYLSDDHFWFTLFHEIGHLLLHKPTRILLEEESQEITDEEHEASEFSANVLIPKKYRSEMANLKLNSKEIIRFAIHIGISPGIVVGQLQHIGKLKFNQLNGLKRRFDWK